MSIHLSPRLLAVAQCVPAGARVIDVGTDHAMIPVWLAQSGLAASIWASDIREGPLRSAAALLDKTDTADRIRLKQTDGLQGFGPEDGDAVILAGMGGETMISILSDAPWVRGNALLILEPQSKQALLRAYLRDNGFSIRSEQLVKDSGRIYPVLTASGGPRQVFTEAELYTGLYAQIAGDPLFGELLASLIRRAETAAPYDAAEAQLLQELRKMEERARA